MQVTLRVNGRVHRLEIDPCRSLADVLRLDLGLVGTKVGCNQGACGACTVLVDEQRVLACLTLAVAAEDAAVTTIEAGRACERVHRLQELFVEHDAMQCGFCTPGQIMSAAGLLHEPVAREDSAVREGMSGNLCRCASYPQILAAVRAAQDELVSDSTRSDGAEGPCRT